MSSDSVFTQAHNSDYKTARNVNRIAHSTTYRIISDPSLASRPVERMNPRQSCRFRGTLLQGSSLFATINQMRLEAIKFQYQPYSEYNCIISYYPIIYVYTYILYLYPIFYHTLLHIV